MRKYLNNPAPLLKRATNIAIAVIICWGFILVLAQIKPFWMDEWRLLYNLKFRTASALFGPLYFTQQFPRVYLVILKAFTAPFDYSYFTLRFPAYITGVCSMILACRLMNRMYGRVMPEKYLFLLIVVASPTFLKYFVQIKQYEMEIFLSLVGIWQLLDLTEAGRSGIKNKRRYILLCLSFIIAPFFSYTYPIVAAPIFLIVIVQSAHMLYGTDSLSEKKRLLLIQLFPLLLAAISIAVFYIIDVSRVMQDTAMQCYWQDFMMSGGKTGTSFLKNIWGFFGSPGSGDLFQGIFSVLGISAFLFACFKSRLFLTRREPKELLVAYALLLLSAVIILFIAGKLPLGEARLNAFTFPAIAILIIHLLCGLKTVRRLKLSGVLFSILYLGLMGNVATTIVNTFTKNGYSKAVRIYSNTEDAILYASAHGLPIVISPEVAWPDNIVSDIPCLDPIDAACVLKTFPAYKEREHVEVFNAVGSKPLDNCILPAGVSKGIVGNGTDFKIMKAGSLAHHRVHK